VEFIVGIPTVNEHELLYKAVESARNSSCRPRQIIIVDNGRDSLVDEYEELAFGPIQIVRGQRNLGVAASWNLMHKLAAPLPIILMNDDCVVAPNTFEKMFERILVYGQQVVLAHGFACFTMKEEIWERVGDFDEGFYPAYWEDTDYRYRLKLREIPVDEWDTSTTGIQHGKDPANYQKWCEHQRKWFFDNLALNRERYITKWGGPPKEETLWDPQRAPKPPYYDPSKYECNCDCE